MDIYILYLIYTINKMYLTYILLLYYFNNSSQLIPTTY